MERDGQRIAKSEKQRRKTMAKVHIQPAQKDSKHTSGSDRLVSRTPCKPLNAEHVRCRVLAFRVSSRRWPVSSARMAAIPIRISRFAFLPFCCPLTSHGPLIVLLFRSPLLSRSLVAPSPRGGMARYLRPLCTVWLYGAVPLSLKFCHPRAWHPGDPGSRIPHPASPNSESPNGRQATGKYVLVLVLVLYQH